MGDPWGIGVLGGEEKPNIKHANRQKNRWKNLKKRRNREKIGKIGFFFTEYGLKCIRNPVKNLSKKHIIGEIGGKSDYSDLT